MEGLKLGKFEEIPSSLDLLLFVKSSIQKGESTYGAIESYLSKNKEGPFFESLSRWFKKIESGYELVEYNNIHRQVLLEILEMGVKGQPILNKLNEFELKLSKAIDDDIERQLKKMPIYSLFPLLFLQLPSLMIIGFVPFLNKLALSMGGS